MIEGDSLDPLIARFDIIETAGCDRQHDIATGRPIAFAG